jgi:hypothetical protein
MSFARRWVLGAWLVGMLPVVAVVGGGGGGVARASVSIAVTWEGLLRESTAAAIVTPIEARAVWENGRIYTYTHVRIDRAIAGDLGTARDAWVRTMGGVVGKIGQIVDGEPVLVPGQSSLLFLHPGPVGAYEVTARGQGQFPVVLDDPHHPGSARFVRSTSVGALVMPRTAAAPATGSTSASPARRLAAEVVHGRAVEDVVHEIADAWQSTHAT